MRILVDTNVFLDYILDREEADEAEKFFVLCRKMKHQIYVTSMSLRDIGYIVQRNKHSREDAKKAQMAVYNLCSKVIGISEDDAIDSLYEDKKDYEDSLQAHSAMRNFVDIIATNNMDDFYDYPIPAISPARLNFVFIRQLEMN